MNSRLLFTNNARRIMGFFSKLFGGRKNDGGAGNEPGLPLEELSRRLKTPLIVLQTTPAEYRELRLAKKSGGTRLLHAPLDPLKHIQRQILRCLLGKLAAHPAAMGFEAGQSIATNAAPHVGTAVIVKMDMKDFFTQTTAARVRSYFVKIGWSGAAADLLTKLTTHKGGLPQGAPTSPRLSNLVNYQLDARLFALALKFSTVYTRYADDMTFSFRSDDREQIALAIRCTKTIVGDYGYSLHQKKKLQIRRQHDRMLVTGLVVNTHLNLPRATRRRLRAVEHHLQAGRPATLSAAQLHGWRALEKMLADHRR